jgi:conjugal transfer pilus assembly protein TraE
MNITAYQAEIRKMIEQRNGYLVLSTGLLFLCLILSFLIILLSGRERIILMPPTMKNDMWVSTQTASPDYFSRMSLFISELALNLTSDNVDYQQELLLRYVDPSYYVVLKPQLVAQADRIKKDHITTAFFAEPPKVDSKNSEVLIAGDLKSYVGDTPLPTKHVSYRIVYRFNSFTPLITKFEEVKSA